MANEFQIEFDADAQRVLRAFRGLAPHIQQGIVKGATRGLLLLETRVRMGAGLKWRRGGAGLSGRLTSWAAQRGDEIDGAIGFRKTRQFPYELAQEFGAKGPMTIPISGQAKAASARGIGPRGIGIDLALVKRSGKPPLLVESRDSQRGWYKGMKTVVHYVIVSGLKPRLKFRQNVRAGMPTLSGEIVSGFRDGVNAA